MRRYKTLNGEGMSVSEVTEVDEWNKFCKLESAHTINSFGFHGDIVRGDAFRFGARFSLASDLSTISINGREESTSDGYAQLMRTVMAWGVVESFYDLKGIKINHENERNTHLVASYEISKLTELKNILNNPQCLKFFSELNKNVNPKHKSKIDEYLAAPLGSYDVSYLFSAIRHVFAHGILTPHSGKVTPQVTVKICKALTSFFLEIVNQGFGNLIRLHPSHGSV